MRSGLFSSIVIIQTKTEVEGALGSTVTWSDSDDYFANIIPISLSARALYQQVNMAEVTHRILFRGSVILSDALANNRFKSGTTYYVPLEESGVINRGRWTEILCKEDRQPDGI